MLLFWISAGVLTVVAVLAITRPLLSAAPSSEADESASEAGANIAVYRDQLAEIDADFARGLISEAEAEAARIEISRRLLAHAEQESARPATAPAFRHLGRERLFNALALAVPVVALGLYLWQGSPGMPGSPVAERLAKAPSAAADIDELVARVEARLRENPSDGQGWEVIAPVYLKLERFREAAEAYRRALDLLGETPRRLSGYAESTMLANDGIVTEDARRAYQRLLEVEPGRIEARFGLAMALEQDGDIDGAEKAYAAIMESSPPNAPWRVFINERLDALAARRGPREADRSDAGRGAAPDPAAAESVAALPDAQRREMIQQMVANLDARLEANGNDPEGWQRLMRSWTVLGDTAKAEAALVRARKALAKDSKALGEINAFAKSLGLKS